MKPFHIDEGLLFQTIRTDADWEQLVQDQMAIAEQDRAAAVETLKASRMRLPAQPVPIFGSHRLPGMTLGDYLQEDAR